MYFAYSRHVNNNLNIEKGKEIHETHRETSFCGVDHLRVADSSEINSCFFRHDLPFRNGTMSRSDSK
jgi:hypothetical protein